MSGDKIKIYKQNNKLVVYLPLEVQKELNLTEEDEVDFFKYSGSAFLFAKKSDIVNMLTKNTAEKSEQKTEPAKAEGQLSDKEIIVLKKLDTIRYPMRSVDNVAKILDSEQKIILKKLVERKIISIFKTNQDGVRLYSISKNIYDKFLMRKNQANTPQNKGDKRFDQQSYPSYKSKYTEKPQFQSATQISNLEHPSIKSLEEQGFLVIQNETEAASVSLLLEDSIRHGQVLGTRAFNKRFYIVKRSFFNKYSSEILKMLGEGKGRLSDIEEQCKISQEAVRSILYLLAENGDVREKRKDVFTLA